MEFYKIIEKEAKKEYYRALIEFLVVIIPVMIVIGLIVVATEHRYIFQNKFLVSLIPAAVCGFLATNYYSSKIKYALKSYILIRDGGFLIRKTAGMPEVIMGIGNISYVTVDLSRGMVVKDLHKTKIFIPKSIERYDEIRAMVLPYVSEQRVAYKRIYWVWHFI